METYTEGLIDYEYSLSSNDENQDDKLEDDFADKLASAALRFRSFGDALTEFVINHGYTGLPDEVEEKVDFIKSRFRSSEIPLPRDISKWFSSDTRIKRPTVYKICFAFGLNLEETNAFFQKVYLDRGFDCHDPKELVYYFCLKNRYS